MKYVLDSNIALKWVLPEPDSTKAFPASGRLSERGSRSTLS